MIRRSGAQPSRAVTMAGKSIDCRVFEREERARERKRERERGERFGVEMVRPDSGLRSV